MLDIIDEYVRAGKSFGFETTLSGSGFARKIPLWRELGYWVKLYFLTLPTPQVAIDRVKRRVLEGGHNIPEETIRRRFHAGLRNFDSVYRHLVDEWVRYDNLGSSLVVVDQGGLGW